MEFKIILSPTTPLGKRYYDQILGLYNVLFVDMKGKLADINGRSAYNPLENLEKVWGTSEMMAVAIEDGQVLGFIQFALYANSQRFLWIQNFCIGEQQRGNGVGKSLINFVSDYGRKKGCAWAELKVLENNPAYDFYQKLGFRTEYREMTMEL